MTIHEFPILEYKYTKCPTCGSYTPIESNMKCCDCDSQLETEKLGFTDVSDDRMDQYYYVNKPDYLLMIQMVYVSNNEGCALQPLYCYDMEYEYDDPPDGVISFGFRRNGPDFEPTADYSKIKDYGPPPYNYFSGGYNYKQHGDFIYVVDKVYPCDLPDNDTFDLKSEGWRGPIDFCKDGTVKVYTAAGKYKRYDGYTKIDYDNPIVYDFDNMHKRWLCSSEEYLLEVEEGFAYSFFANKNGLKSLGIALEK